MEERVEKIEKQLLELQLGVNKKAEKKPRPPRPLTEYNNFVKKYIDEQKLKLGPDYQHKKVFREAAEAWKKSKEKP